MIDRRVIRIEAVDFDYLRCFVQGTVVCRQANGVLTRRRVTIPAQPDWTHGQAVHAISTSGQDDSSFWTDPPT